MIDVSDILESSLFLGTSAEELRDFLSVAPNNMRHYVAGDIIARRGEACRSVSLIALGVAEAFMVNPEGKELKMDELHATDILAPAFIYASVNTFPVTVMAKTPCEILVINRDAFLTFMQRSPEVLRNFLRIISDRSLFLAKKVDEFALQSLRSRVLKYLQTSGRLENVQAVALRMGVQRPSLSRVLSELVAEGRVARQGNVYILCERS